jgi:predicted dehydrogenase
MKLKMKNVGQSKARIRYAVVGLGHLAQVAVLPGFKQAPNSELFAIVSGDAKKRATIGKKYRLDHVYSYDDYEQALSVVDAVYLVLPNHLHREYAVRAANAGVHVLCEKPMAVTEEDCEAMLEAAHQNNVKLMIAYRLHFEKANLEAMRLAKSRRLGELRIFSSEFAQQVATGNVRITQPVSNGGGAVYDMGVYCINAARYLFQSEPTEIFAATANNRDPRFREVEEMTSVVMRFPEERLASFTCSFGASDISRYALIGTKGVLTADPAYDYSMALKHHLTIGAKATTQRFPKRDQFAAEISYFSDCILKNKDPEPSGLEGLADVRIIQAIYESASAQQVVKLPSRPGKKRPVPKEEIHKPSHGKPQTVKVKSPSRD